MAITTGGAADNAKVQLSRPRISSKGATFATVLVGPDEDRFVVHEAVLVYHSKFFRAALTGGSKEAQKKMVKLQDVESDTFEFFVHWLYYQQLPSLDEKDDAELVKQWQQRNLYEQLVEMYIFAKKYCIESLQRQILDAYFGSYERDRGY